MSIKRSGGSARRSPAENTANEILDVLSHLKGLFHGPARLDEQARLSERDLAKKCTMVLVRNVEEMRDLGADKEMIIGTLQVAIEALRTS